MHSQPYIRSSGGLAARCMAMLLACALGASVSARAESAPKKGNATQKSRQTQATLAAATDAEARLIEIYRLIGQARTRTALEKARALVQDLPNFQLAQLVYGDLLSAQTRPLRLQGDVPDGMGAVRAQALTELRHEAALRMAALRERPVPGTVPAQFVALSRQNRHAIAVDSSRSRLYLFENTPAGLRLLSDHYISLGKAGIDKLIEGDQRTPLGVYFVTSNLDPKTLRDFYGAGALPINYPNALDLQRGKTGSGIWLHGTPPSQFARAPLATDGCVVLANPDLEHILRTVQIRTTPVVIARQLQWVSPGALRADAQAVEQRLRAWGEARSSGNLQLALSFYSQRMTPVGLKAASWRHSLEADPVLQRQQNLELKDLSALRWTDTQDTMVVTFAELIKGQSRGVVKRQYWVREDGQWRIFSDGVTR